MVLSNNKWQLSTSNDELSKIPHDVHTMRHVTRKTQLT